MILQLSLKPPFPKVDGGCVAIASMTESLLFAGHEVKLLTMETDKHPFAQNKFPKDIAEATAVESVFIDTRIKPLDALLNLFSSKSYNIERFYSKSFESRIEHILDEYQFDVIHLESIFCAPYLSTIRKKSKGKVVIRTHNVEFEIWEQLASNEKNPLKKLYLKLLAKRLKQYEVQVLNEVDGLIPITATDASQFSSFAIKTPMEVVPIGLNVAETETSQLDNQLSLYHLGAMDWAPNIEGVEWFLDEVWPKIEQEIPEASLNLAGRKMPNSFISRSRGKLEVQGEVPDASGFISNRNIAIIPIRSGSGMRVKIVEALAHGKVVITTNLGASGINYTDGQNILIANTADEFVSKIKALKDNPPLISSIGNEARELAKRDHDLGNLSSKLTYFYGKL